MPEFVEVRIWPDSATTITLAPFADTATVLLDTCEPKYVSEYVARTFVEIRTEPPTGQKPPGVRVAAIKLPSAEEEAERIQDEGAQVLDPLRLLFSRRKLNGG